MPETFRLVKDILGGIRVLGASLVADAALYRLRKAYHIARFNPEGQTRDQWGTLRHVRTALAQGTHRSPPPPADQFTFLGALRRHRVDGQTIELICDGGALWLTILAPDLIRVRLSPDGRFAALFSYAIEKTDEQWPACDFLSTEEGNQIVIRTQRLTCRVARFPCRLSFFDPDDTLISEDMAGNGYAGDWVGCWRRLLAGEHIYGLGEKAFGLDHRGRSYEMWSRDPGGYSVGDDPLYMTFPIYLGLRAGRAYGLFFDNTYRSIFDIGRSEPDTLSFTAEGGELRYYFFYGPSPATVLERYTQLTGRMQLPPIWALGYHQSRWSYYPECRVRQIAAEFRRRDIPCDALHFDIHYMDGYRDFTWDRQRFPDPAKLLADLSEAGFQSVALIDAGIKADPTYAACASGLQRDVFVRYPDGSLFSGPVWPGNCYFPDFTAPRTREWWAEQYAQFLQVGLAGTWNDMNEPVVMGHTGDCPPDHVRHDQEGLGADHRALHNIYGMQMARATCEAMRQARPNRRPFVITRSAFCGVQRYSLGWTGDNVSTWESLALTIPMVLNLGVSGLSFIGPDTGGFGGDASGELLARWTQLGAFTPYFRNHSALLTHAQEPWAFGEPYTSICRNYIALRYRFLPALYTAFWQSAQTGAPIARPMFWAWPADERLADIEDQYMVGDHLLVAPVLKLFGMERPVYLPAGEWYDWANDSLIVGPTDLTASAPLDVLPLYVRAGAVLPLAEAQNVRQTTDVWQRLPSMTLHVYAGNATSHLYEDAGEGLDHLVGQYRHTAFATSWDSRTLTLRRQIEGDYQPPYTEYRLIIHGLPARLVSATLDGEPAQCTMAGDPPIVQLTAGAFYDFRVEFES